MKSKGAFALQSFFLCILFNGAFAALIYFMADKALEGLSGWLTPFLGANTPAPLPEQMHLALNNFGTFLTELRRYLLPGLAALASAVTLLLWFFLYLAGARQIRLAEKRAGEIRSVPPPEIPRDPIESERQNGPE